MIHAEKKLEGSPSIKGKTNCQSYGGINGFDLTFL